MNVTHVMQGDLSSVAQVVRMECSATSRIGHERRWRCESVCVEQRATACQLPCSCWARRRSSAPHHSPWSTARPYFYAFMQELNRTHFLSKSLFQAERVFFLASEWPSSRIVRRAWTSSPGQVSRYNIVSNYNEAEESNSKRIAPWAGVSWMYGWELTVRHLSQVL